MIAINSLIFGCVGIAIGIGTTILYVTNVSVNVRLKRVENYCKAFPSIEDIATKILTMKMPVDKLPPDVAEAYRKEVETQGAKHPPLNAKKETYFG